MRMSQKLQKQLKELGSKLKSLPASKDALLKLLKQAANYLSELEQSPSAYLLESLQPLFNVIAKPRLLKHQDGDVKLLVATCICEITRITAPEAPYNDDVLREIFSLIVGTFRGLSDASGPSFGRRVVILDTLAKYRSCIVMLDLECYDLIKEMFSIFFSVASTDLPENVQVAMETIMVVLIEESEDVPDDILQVILSNLGRDKKEINPAARKLAMDVIKRTAEKLESEVKQFLISSISGVGKSSDNNLDYHEVIYDIYHCAPNILLGVIPYLTVELSADQVDARLKAVNLVGDLSALPGSSILKVFQPVFSEFLKRLIDSVAEVRMVVLAHIRNCLLSNPSSCEAPQIYSALGERLLDFDENVRKQVVSLICDVACHDLRSVPVETLKLVGERLGDESVLVRNHTMERLAEIYKLDCASVSDDEVNNDFDWIPGKILRCYYDKDFRSDVIEPILSNSMFPSEFSVKNKVKHWVKIFAGFDKVDVKALVMMLEQKYRLQQEMQKYLSLRPTSETEDVSEYQKKVMFCFKVMSRMLPDTSKAEELFQTLDRIKDAKIWGLLTTLLESDTLSHQACALRDDLLKTLGDNHPLYNFLGALSVKLSYVLFDKEHVHELLLEASVQKAAGNTQYVLSCMNILEILARYCPSLFRGTENDLILLLKDESEIIREGILHVLANAGGTIKEQFAVSSSPIDLMLETLCLEGSRKQAKYAVQALAAITEDEGLMSLSILYKRLVDILDEKTHLPVVLQSLGCIAQTAMPVFETREPEIVNFIKSKILNCSSKVEDVDKTSWDDRSELCLLKIFSLKALVKSYLPVKDVQHRPGIDDLIEILKNMLLYGEISKEIKSSSVDKAHLKLASAKAILQLSRCWNQNIPVDVFHLVVKSSEVTFPEYKKLFLRKVHQYLKDEILDGKYACAFVTNMYGSLISDFEQEKQNLWDVIQMYDQTKTRHLAAENDKNIVIPYPEGIIPYLIHVLAHHSLPNIDECKDLESYEQIYRQLYLFLSLLVNGNDDTKLANSENKNERIAAITSILLSIQSSEDVMNAGMSKHSHAICDLGISIIKRLAQKEDAVLPVMSSVTLPPVLYKPTSKSEENHNEGVERTWLTDESSLAHFTSLKLDTNCKNDPENEDEDSEEANKISLENIVQNLKSRSSKGKRARKIFPPAKSKSIKQQVDDLKMVREINLEKLELPSDSYGPVPNGIKKLDKISDKRKHPNSAGATPVPVPKRRRSLTTSVIKSSNSKSSAKFLVKGSKENLPAYKIDSESSDSREHLPVSKRKVANPKSDLLVSCLNKKVETSKQKVKKVGRGSNGRSWEKPVSYVTEMSGDITVSDENGARPATGSSKKRKRRSVAVLAKCTAKEDENHDADLVGCRIKIWWPLDKEFYEGVVKSYMKKTKEHQIAYDDGDVEMLSLHKERWSYVDNSLKSPKAKSVSKKSKSSEKSSKYKSNGRKKDDASKISRPIILGLRAPMKTVKKAQDKRLKGFKTTSVGSDVKDLSNDSDLEPDKPPQSGDSVNDEAEKMQEDEHAEIDTREEQVTKDPDNTTKHDESEKLNNEMKESCPKPESEENTGSKDNTKTSSDPPVEAKEITIHSGISQQANPNATPSSPEIPNASISSNSPVKENEEDEQPLIIWRQKVSKKSNERTDDDQVIDTV